VFEINLLDVSQLAPEAWAPIRGELQSIALVRPEDEIQIGNRPFLRFHPTLACRRGRTTPRAAAGDAAALHRRLWGLMQMLDKALTGSQSRAALAILDREEANYRWPSAGPSAMG
jgi:hypothetical protein